MEREELLQEVQVAIEADGKKLSPSISEETINAELDDELENIGDDEEANKKVIGRIAKRLLRIDGNIHSNVSREVKEYKKTVAPKQVNGGDGNQSAGDGDEMPSWAQKLVERIDAVEKSRKDREDAAAKDAIVGTVKKGLKAKFKEADVEVNDYIFRQTMRDLEIPDVEDGDTVDTDGIIRKMERAYYKALKEAGLDKKDSGRSRFGGREGSDGESAADRFFARKGKREGWAK